MGRIIERIKRALGINSPGKKDEEEKEIRDRIDMCDKSIESGVCPKDCNKCAWNWNKEEWDRVFK